MREIDVAHEAEDKCEAARNQEVEARQSHAVQDRADERLLSTEQPVEPVGPDPEDHPKQHGAGQKTGADPDLSRGGAGDGICESEAHAVSRRRCSFILGAL